MKRNTRMDSTARGAAATAVCALLLTGCITVGPDYQEPTPELPDAWQSAALQGLPDGEAALQTWWTVFEDPALEELIAHAEAANLDLRTAVWRVEEARAQRGVAAGARSPQVGFDGTSSRQQPSDNGPLGELAPDGFEAGNMHDYGVGASWEIDLWGRVRRTVESADAAMEALARDVSALSWPRSL